MSITMILNRMWRSRRVLGVLLLAMCCVSGFFAFSPLYLRIVGEAALRYTIDTNSPARFSMQLRADERMSLDDEVVLRGTLGDLVGGVELVTTTATYFCGNRIEEGSLCFADSRQPFGFSRVDDRFSLVDGRFPLETPETGGVDAEGVVTRTVSETAWQQALIPGEIITIPGVNDRDVRVRIVGIVEPVNAADPFWETLRLVTEGVIVDVNENNQRYDWGVIVPESVMDRLMMPISTGMDYRWHITTNIDVLRTSSLVEVNQQLNRAEGEFIRLYPSAALIGGLRATILQFLDELSSAEAPVILLSTGVLLLLLYQLVTTVAMILEQEGAEWATISSRGGSAFQLMRMQGLTMLILGGLAFLLGLPIAMIIAFLLARVGPLAEILSEGGLNLVIPVNSLLLSATAALLAVIALTLPAFPAARRGILRLKQAVSRPPVHPVWARYFLDFLLLMIGVGFLLRLYYQVGGSSDVVALLQNPSLLLDAITSDAARDAGILSDPFNLAGIGLLIVGAALLWLRIFPLIMRIIGTGLARLNNLLLPLALWSVERDPSHYAQLVMLLIGTLALGTASLVLSATHDAGAWRVAQQVTGSDANVTLDPLQPDVINTLVTLPEVRGGAALIDTVTDAGEGEVFVRLLGVDPALMSANFPEWREPLAPLVQEPPLPLRGLPLPLDAQVVRVDVYATAPAPGVVQGTPRTLMSVQLENSLGMAFELPLSTPDDSLVGQFMRFETTLPANGGFAPYRLVGFKFDSPLLGSGQGERTVNIDRVATVDAAGTETLIESFEQAARPAWTQANQIPGTMFTTVTTARASEGQGSLRVDYTINFRGAALIEPVLTINQVPAASLTLPIVVTERFADVYGRRTGLRRGYQVGDSGTIPLQIRQQTIDLPMRIVGIIGDFPTLTSDSRAIIARADGLALWLNMISAAPNARLVSGDAPYFAFNRAWLALNTRETPAQFEEQLNGISGVQAVEYAWERYNQLRREPLPNAITGMLFAGFWVSLGLGVLDFGFYLAMTAQRRATSFAVLRAMGWDAVRLWGLLTVEQTALVLPALVIGIGLGAVLAYLLLPFLALLGQDVLQIPADGIGLMVAALLIAFGALLAITAGVLRRMSVNQALRVGEE